MFFAAVVAAIAESKGRSSWQWFLYGMVLGPIAFLHALVTYDARKKQEPADRA